jgi:hypothetical protein
LLFSVAWKLRCLPAVNTPQETVVLEHSGADAIFQHNLVIGPLCHSDLFKGKARLYSCTQCKWSFLVGGSKVVALDRKGHPFSGAESTYRFETFGDGPCPTLESLIAEFRTNHDNVFLKTQERI